MLCIQLGNLFEMGLNGQTLLTTKSCTVNGPVENCKDGSLLPKIHIGFKDELKMITFTILIILPIGFPQSRFNKILEIFSQ